MLKENDLSRPTQNEGNLYAQKIKDQGQQIDGTTTKFQPPGPFLKLKPTMDCAGTVRDGSVLVPDQVIARFLHESGLNTSYPTASRIIAKTTQKFINDVASSAISHAAHRTNQNPEEPESKFTLTLDDLYKAVEEYDDSLLIPEKAQYFH